MRIGELAELSGLSRDALRFYEKEGLLKSRRRTNGYRDYGPEVLIWLQYVRTAQTLGFTLNEIRTHGARVKSAVDPERELEALLREKLQMIDLRIVELKALRQNLEARLGQGCPLHA